MNLYKKVLLGFAVLGLSLFPIGLVFAAGNSVQFTANTNIAISALSGNLVIASGSAVASYSVNTTTLTLNVDSGSSVTVESASLWTLTNSDGAGTLCNNTADSYVTFTASSPRTVTVTPTTTVACSGRGGGSSVYYELNVINAGTGIGTVTGDGGLINCGSTCNSDVIGGSSVTLIATPNTNSSFSSWGGDCSAATTTACYLTMGSLKNVTANFSQVASSGGGGSTTSTSAPTASFTSNYSAVALGQSAVLTWTTTNANAVSINQGIGAVGTSGSTTVTPTSTTSYILTATGSGGTTNQTVTVTLGTVNIPTIPPVTSPSGLQTPGASAPGSVPSPISPSVPVRLVNSNGTFYLIINNVLHGITNPGMLTSYGFVFSQATPATASDLALSQGPLLLPNDGALVKTAQDPTIYLISNQTRHGFVSASVFLGLGFKWASVLVITAPELNQQSIGNIISEPNSQHLPGLDINKSGTIYYIGLDNQLHGYPDLAIYNSWHIGNDFSKAVPANAEDMSLPVGSLVGARVTQ